MKDIVISLYAFGSCLTNDTPDDIDLLWVYDKNTFTPQKALAFVRQKTFHLKSLTYIPIHNTIISENEEASVQFVASSQAKHLSSWANCDENIECDGITQIDCKRREKGLCSILKSDVKEDCRNEA